MADGLRDSESFVVLKMVVDDTVDLLDVRNSHW